VPRSLVPSLLQALALLEGESLVMHAGERPYVVTATDQVVLSETPMDLQTMNGVLDELLSPADRDTIASRGVVHCTLPAHPLLPQHRFAAVAARTPGDAWIEIVHNCGDARAADDAGRPCVDWKPVLRRTADILPLTRPPASAVPMAQPSVTRPSGFERLVRLAVARGASTLYLREGTPPRARVDGTLQYIDGSVAMGASELRHLLDATRHESDLIEAAREWTVTIEGLGQARCVAYVDDRGHGAVVHLPMRQAPPEQVALPPLVIARASELNGLVLVASPRGGGLDTMIGALTAEVCAARALHAVRVTEGRGSRSIASTHGRPPAESVREVVGLGEAILEVRAALREDPDVLAVGDVRRPELVEAILDAAVPGRLVIAGVPARGAVDAIDALLSVVSPAARPRLCGELARALSAVLAQAVVPRVGGGQVAVREWLLHTPRVSALLGECRIRDLQAVIDSGADGMLSMTEGLRALVRRQVIGAREAYAAAADRQALRASLEQDGMDPSELERLA